MGKTMLAGGLSAALLFVAGSAVAATPVDVAKFIRKDAIEDIKLSPRGDYYAATVPGEGKSVVMVVRRSDNEVTAVFRLGNHTYVHDFAWVNPDRILVSMAEKIGALDQPRLTGNLYAINADGTDPQILVGQDVDEMSTGTRIRRKRTEHVAAFLVDDLPDDDRHVLIEVSGFAADAYSRVERMDVYTGRRVQVVRGPVRNAHYVTDNAGVVRFAAGYDLDNNNKLFHRAGNDAEWELLNEERVSGRVEFPLGFSADGGLAYLQVQHPEGPDSIVAFDPATGSRTEVFRDDDTDPLGVVRGARSVPVGVTLSDGRMRTAFFDPQGKEAQLVRSLAQAFPDEVVGIASMTADGALVLVEVGSDRNAGDFYLYDTRSGEAAYMISRRDWLDPADMAAMRPVTLAARDGLPLHGYVTVPPGSGGKGLPLVVMPHGGPFRVADVWGFDPTVQLLAASGYAVLQVNFRGSSNHGRAFTQAGAGEWGGKMQDDLTDATRWAIAEGLADPTRICIFGASYGGYAALMGAAREQGLYRCAVGYVGVYDLPLMFSRGDMKESRSTLAYLRDWVGDPQELDAISPVNLADRISVPVFLAAGGEDRRAPIDHSRRMEKALRAAGVPVETLYYDSEGHGFYVDAHRQEFHERLLAFLSRSLGAPAAAGEPASGDAGSQAAP